MRLKSSESPPTSRAHYVSHPGVRFNALNNPAKPSGRRHGLGSTVAFPWSTFRLFIGCWLLMRRSGDGAADFLALGSCQCRFKILGDVVGAGGCGEVSSGALATDMAGSAVTALRT